jgi:2-iminobutanoate/2-iminopropanoate deaminase
MKTVISSPAAPAAIGPYSQAIEANGLVFLSGQIPLDPATGQLVEGDATAQTERMMQNLEAVLAAAGCTFADVVRTGVFLVDLADFAKMNEVYSKRFASQPPARSTIQVAALPRGARVEIEMTAVKPR